MVRKASPTLARRASVRAKGKNTSKSKSRSVGKVKSSQKERSAVGIVTNDLGIARVDFPMINSDEQFIIYSVSSFCLRNGSGGVKDCSENVPFVCSVCKKYRVLGKTSFAYFRINYGLAGVPKQIQLCDDCSDLLCELVRNGPQVLAVSWPVICRTTKIFALNTKLMCYSCLSTWSTHISFKFTSVKYPNTFYIKRVCARCAITYIELALNDRRFKSKVNECRKN